MLISNTPQSKHHIYNLGNKYADPVVSNARCTPQKAVSLQLHAMPLSPVEKKHNHCPNKLAYPAVQRRSINDTAGKLIS